VSRRQLLLLAAIAGCAPARPVSPERPQPPTGVGGAGTSGVAAGAAGGVAGGGSGGARAGGMIGGVGTGGTGAGGVAMPGGAGAADAAPETTAPVGTGCSTPGTLCWDFEEGRLPTGWSPYRNEFAGQLLVDETRPHRGRYALHAKGLAGGAEGSQGGPKKTVRYALPPDFGPVLWGRVHVYTTPARPQSHAGLFNARYPRPGMAASSPIDKLDWYELATFQQKYMSIWHPPEPPGYPEWVLVSDHTSVLDAWACLEWQFDGANGSAAEAAEPRVWVDGSELPWPQKSVFADPATTVRPRREKAQTFTVLEAGAYLYQGLPTATDWWFDDLAVGTQRIGCE
jgi:hypothetical protein